MTRTRWLWIGMVLIALAGVLTLFYGEALREHVLRPLLYELWLWGLRLSNLANLIWFLLLVLAGVSFYVVVLDVVLSGRRHTALQEKAHRTGPVQALAHKIELACHGELARWNVHRVVGEIAIQWIALREGIGESQARQRFQERAILPQLHDALDLEFPGPSARRGWLWLSERFLPPLPGQRCRRLHELAQLTQIVEDFVEEIYASTSGRR